MDFFQVRERETKRGVEVYADFIVGPSSDLMIRGGAFYAIWDEGQGRWSTNELDVLRLIDVPIYDRVAQLRDSGTYARPIPLSIFNNGSWTRFQNYCSRMPNTYIPLDSTLVFANQPVKKEDHSSKRLPYDMNAGPHTAYDKLMSVLFDPGERQKLEWAIGSIIAGDSREIQKFIVLYGEAGTGKSTFLNILERLFEGYWVSFDAQALIKRSHAFAMEAFKTNPVVAISHDSDLSMIEDNTLLNSVVSHDTVPINEKFKSLYAMRIISFIFVGTNLSVRITDAKSGLIRRLIDVNPTGKRVPAAEYDILVSQISFELGAIAHYCLGVYRAMGKHYYANYQPTDMMVRTDVLYNFLLASFDMISARDGITLKEAWNLYKDYCKEAGFERHLNMHRFRDEMRNYFDEFHVKIRISGEEIRSLFRGFKVSKLNFLEIPESPAPSIVLDQTKSLLDDVLGGSPAQYANEEGTPLKKWVNVRTTLSQLDTSKLHYVKPPENHIVIDFDLKGDTGEKSLQFNLEAASKFPPTYAEYSQSGLGVHLHYIYTSDVTLLSRVYDAGIEVKVFTGDSSLRRKMTKCSNVPVAMISDGLPLKEKRVIDTDQIRSEKGLRRLIQRNLFKEIHPGTKPSIDFIHKILEDACESGMTYDVADMRPRILAFANNSTNHAQYCIKKVLDMKFTSSQEETSLSHPQPETEPSRIAFFDVEIFPNLFVLCWKYHKASAESTVKLVNPSPSQIEEVVKLPLAGYNNRRFDNHILWARIMGYSEMDLFKLSQRIISGDRNSFFSEAYGLSYADIFDFLSEKKSLKRWQIELGLNHRELGFPWDQPVDPSRWQEVVDYCVNDVVTEEAVFEHRQQDFVARKILASLSGLRVNDTTQRHTARIIFGDDKHPQDKFVYTDLSQEFPDYRFEAGKSTYHGEVVGEGGYVYAEPGMYENVAVLDIASMHPTSIELLDLFGPYTRAYSDLKTARIAIKHGDYGRARTLLGGALKPFLGSAEDSRALSYALKIVLNIVYGLTSASFDNPFRDLRNKDNIVAKRGALFMIDLKSLVQSRGFKVIHIKTDSVKIPDADQYIIDYVKKTGEDYGYNFEHEVTFSKICLVNDAVYIARTKSGEWTATGAQFAHSFVFKTLFSHEPVEFPDLCETRSVAGAALYLDFNDGDPHFVGSAGSFTPVKEGAGGGALLRGKDGVYHSASGAKGYFWKEAAVVKELGLEDQIDMGYFRKLADDAVAAISKHGDFEWFTS